MTARPDFSHPEVVAEQFGVSRESMARLQRYVDVLIRWNRSINLIGASTAEHIWQRHIADSLQLRRFLDTEQSLVDLGSGAGFPGLALALAFPEGSPAFAHLIESNRKKAAFLANAIRMTDAPAGVIPKRIEEVDVTALVPQPAVAVARALAPLARLLQLAQGFLGAGLGAVFLKGQDVESELTEAAKSWRIDADVYPSLVDASGRILVIRQAVHRN
ncbi:16S rRNA (guanine(527)-N(7))-methyltransferase RsmG [Rhodoligotrophos defluvii]|uniref:16S rRNA (guanine(527)-N(7))-methyltransferase RsmG n=1 Tax=Rhodoligotrophos defluvii TaxID=2561934 RepID=UPI0010C95F52|nr:16S rRNA (guanine(527)-N(7))-methyltransferase RsmG [Rhodoligotrophos defluvii]